MDLSHRILYLFLAIGCCSGEVLRLNSSNWKQVFEGDWLIEFYAPWCPACRQFAPVWEELSKTNNLNVNVAAIDVTESPVLSFLFFVNRLPTIFHVKDSAFRYYDGSRTLGDLKTYVFEDGYKNVEPMPWYFSPSSKHMQFFCRFMDLGMAITQMHQSLLDAGYPTWMSFIMIGSGTIVFGLILGTILVVFCDCFCPPRPQALRIFRRRPQKPKSEETKSPNFYLLKDFGKDDVQSSPRYVVDASGEHEDEDEAAAEVRKRTVDKKASD